VGRFPKKYKGFMDDADQDEHLNITNLLSAALDEDKWDRSIYGKFLMRIELVCLFTFQYFIRMLFFAILSSESQRSLSNLGCC
jgi:hypothetical protein